MQPIQYLWPAFPLLGRLAVLLIYHLAAVQGYIFQTGKSTTKLESVYKYFRRNIYIKS